MAVLLVERPEVVQVQQQQRQALAGPGAAFGLLGEPLLEAAVVVQAGERVGVNQGSRRSWLAAQGDRHVVEDRLQQADLVGAADVEALRPVAAPQRLGGLDHAVQRARQAPRHERAAGQGQQQRDAEAARKASRQRR